MLEELKEEEKRQDENFIRNMCKLDASQLRPEECAAECSTLFDCFAPLTGCFPIIRFSDDGTKAAAWYCLRKYNQLQGDCDATLDYRATTYQHFSQFKMLFTMLNLPTQFRSDLSQSGGLDPVPIDTSYVPDGSCSALAVIDAYLEHTKKSRKRREDVNAYFSLVFIVNTLIQRKWLYNRVARRRAAAFMYRASTWCRNEQLAQHLVTVGDRAVH